jgi:hypothetical protein
MSADGLSITLSKRVAILESRAAVADLVHRYAFNIRSGRAAECRALFTEDAVFEMRESNPANPAADRIVRTLVGPDAIIAYIGRTAASNRRVYPLIYNLLIEFDELEARSSCMMTARAWPGGQELLGEYRDTYRYESGWRFSGRVHTILKDSAPVAAADA